MSRSPPSQDRVLNLAKQQLDYPASTADSRVLHALVPELEKHIRLYPHDINFHVKAHGGIGYGIVTCFEDGCEGAEIPLVERVDAPNGGRDVGLGSLSAYRKHITDEHVHVTSRNARVARGEGLSPRPISRSGSVRRMSSVRKSNILQALDPSLSAAPVATTPLSHIPSPSSKMAIRRALARSSSASHTVKVEPVEAFIPRKRSSDMGLDSRVKPEPFEFPGFGTPDAKKIKLEVPKTPLARVNREDASPATIVKPTLAQVAENSADDTREKLSEVQSYIMNVEAKLYKAEGKRTKTKADFTRISKLRNELSDLKELKDKYNASLPSMKPLSRTGSGGARFMGSPVKPSIASGRNLGVPLPPPFHNPAYNSGIVASQPVLANNANVIPQFFPPQQPVASGSNVTVEAASVNAEVAINFQKLTAGVPGFSSSDPDDERFDNDGDFYGRGKDHFMGPVAKADDIDKFLIAAGNSEQFDGNASVDKALEKLGLQALYQPLPGMEVALMPHQTIGVAWMLEKERGPMKGGCLADEMGLGKTVQMIATIVANRSADPLMKTTLIISPLALLDQWQQEIELKTNIGFKCLLYHGSTKVRRAGDLRKYDIVLTTYQTLAFEWPDDEAAEREKKRKSKKKRNVDGFIVDDSDGDNKANVKIRGRKTLGLLFEVEWYSHRIVLDESQNIRNKRTRVSRAVTKLNATYRWCLSGTPIINGLADAYAPIRFLRIRPFYDWTSFNEHITLREKKRPDLATNRLQAIFATMLLRRKKDSMLDGKKLIELPSKEVRLVKLQFSQEERDVYNMVESRSQEVFNRFLRAGTVLKNYTQVLVLLLRLRQICAHPCLITESEAAFVTAGEAEDNGNYSELARAQKAMGLDFVLRMREKFKRVALERMEAEQTSADATLEGEDYECPICFDSYTDAMITPCGHTFCRECITSVLNGVQREDANEQNQYKADERPCPTCRGAVTKGKLFARAAFEPTDADLKGKEPASSAQKRDEDVEMTFIEEKPGARPGRALRKQKARSYIDSEDEGDDDDDEDDDVSDFIVDDDEDEEEAAARVREKKRLRGKGKARAIVLSDDEDNDVICGARPDFVRTNPEQVRIMPKFLPSTKMKHMMETLRKWAEEHPDEKTLIISQWTSCLQLVSDYLTENGFLHVKYQGDMKRTKRDTAVRVFMAKDKATIMLMSMKCGGVGLNLTRANRVISLDLGWSEAVEAQAFDRVHRLGQAREVFVRRLVIADTVEDRILALQDRKKLLADCSLGEGTAKKLGRLSVKELANLFGLDHRGHVINQE